MWLVDPAARTELTQLNPVRVIPPVLLRGVCPLAAHRARQVYHDAVFFLRQLLLQYLR